MAEVGWGNGERLGGHGAADRVVEDRGERHADRFRLPAGSLPEPADLDALTSMILGSFYGRYVTSAGIPCLRDR